MVFVLRGKRVLALCLAIILLLSASVVLWRIYSDTLTVAGLSYKTRHTPVLDAGHGGHDGGSVSLSGVAESGINLNVALRCEQVMLFMGICPVMTRSEDISLHDKNDPTITNKKRADLNERVRIVRGTDHPVLISIHQNIYQNSRYSGAQTFYNTHQSAPDLARTTQETLRAALDPDNDRIAMKANSSIFLMKTVECPAMLVECGFLSNPQDDKLLQTEAYQIRIALAITAGFMRFDAGQDDAAPQEQAL